MQQVKATQEAQSKKVTKKKEDKDSERLHKDGTAAVPKQAGAYSIKGGRGWFTGGFRQRAPMLMMRRQPAVQDGAISEAAQEMVDEDEDCWDRVDKPTVYVGICIVIFLIIAVTVPVSLVRNEEPAPTPSPTSSRFFVLDEFQAVFSEVSDPKSFEDPNSAQSQALNWIVYDDGLGLSPNDDAAIQRYISMVIYFGNGGEDWDGARLDTAWGSSIPECEWDYIVCTANQTIGELGFLGVGLTGTLEAEMLNLSELSSLDLAGNELSEVEFPSLILQMTNLVELFLDTNNLQGSIPSEIANLGRLEKLIMSSNDFTGTLPIEMQSMTSMLSFQVPLNRLEGNVFNIVTGWPDLKTLDLGNNDFFGTIPSQLGLQRSLAKISLERNDFRGSLPTELGDLTTLRSLVVTQNFRLDGNLPTQLGNCDKLEQLQFTSNNFVGTIPTEFGNLLSLRDLRFQQNEMTGAIPTELGLLTNLEVLDCSNNEFVEEVPSELGELTALTAMQVHFTDVSGSMPEEICALRKGVLATLQAQCFDVNAQIQCERPECCTQCH
jgi:Leucine-rich repeat (LRR) protein